MNACFTPTHKLRRLLPLLALPLLPLAAAAQTLAPYAGSATGNTGGSTYPPLVPTGVTAVPLSGGDRNEGYFNSLPIGFRFNFAGTVYTTFSASTNGWMTFGQPLTDAASFNDLVANLNSTTNLSVRPIVAPLWDDLAMGTSTGAATDGNLYYKTTGTAGTRICTIEWRNMRWDPTATSPVVSFIVRLKEGSNIIDFTYSQPSGGSSGSGSRSASVGLGGPAVADYLSATSLSSSATFSRTNETTNLSSRPTNGRQLVFTPTGLATRSAEALATFQLTPNPATAEVRLVGHKAGQPVSLFDGQGRLLRTQTNDLLDLRGLARGLYLVRVGEGSRRLVVE